MDGATVWLGILSIVVTVGLFLIKFFWSELKEVRLKVYALQTVIEVLRNDADHLGKEDERLFTLCKETGTFCEKEIEKVWTEIKAILGR